MMVLSRLFLAAFLACACFATVTTAHAQGQAGRAYIPAYGLPYNITRADIASVKSDGGGAFRSAVVTLTPAATQAFHQFTKDKAGRTVMISVDGAPVASIIIMEPVNDGILVFSMTPDAEKILGPLMR